MQLSLAGGLFGDVGEPCPIHLCGGEAALDAIIAHDWVRSLCATSALYDHRSDAIPPTQSCNTVTSEEVSLGVGSFIMNQSIPECWIICVNTTGGIHQMRVVPITLAHRLGLPGVERLFGETQYPTRPGNRNPLSSQLDHQGIHHFGSVPRPK